MDRNTMGVGVGGAGRLTWVKASWERSEQSLGPMGHGGHCARRCRPGAALVWSACVALGAIACGAGPDEAFVEHALPILEARCATGVCHGVDRGEAWPEGEGLFFQLDRGGAIADPERARERALTRVVTAGPARLSTLIRIPMPEWAGGGPHAGGALFNAPGDPAVRDLVRWIETETAGGEDLELDEREILFGETVLPILVERCAFAGCHGPGEVAFTAFDARPDRETGAFAPREIRAAYRAARKHLNLWGSDPVDSRLVRKAIGAVAGGMIHRGGINTFFPEAPLDRPLEAEGLQAILDWARAEREALGAVEGQAPTHMLFVRGPADDRPPYRIDNGPVGSDLYLAPWPPTLLGAVNLTTDLHPGEQAEVRDPAVSHDGTRILFSMRRSTEDRFTPYEMVIEGRRARALVAEDAPGSFVQATYAADGRVVAAWDGHEELGADGPGVAPELVSIDSDGTWERLTFTPTPEMSPAMLATGKTRGELIFGTRRRGPTGTEGVLFRFPLCHDDTFHGEPEYHVQFGASVAPVAPLIARDLPDGRQVMLMLANTDVEDDRGRIALLDRSLGPSVPGDRLDELSMGGYRAPVAWLGEHAGWRDPAPLPDGSFLAASDAAGAPGEDAIYLVRHVDSAAGTSLGSSEVLLSVSGEALRSPVAIFRRPFEDDDHEPVTDSDQPTGLFALRDVAMLEALYGRAAAVGARNPRPDIHGIRLLRWVGVREGEVERHTDGGTTVGLTNRLPAEVLMEHALPADRSAWLQVPARTPILLQWLDARGMVVGNQLDRWFFAEGLETIPGGTNAATFPHKCAGCHGSMSGEPEHAAAPPPDAISAASVTLSTHRNRDRRQPLSPETTPTTGRGVDFVHDVAPIFEATCGVSDCHGAVAPPADLALDARPGSGRFSAAYETLLSRYIDRSDLRARRSSLMERLWGEELDAPEPVTYSCVPGQLSDGELHLIAQWIETGAFFDLTAREGE